MKVIYNHPSIPLKGIKVDESYDLSFVKTIYKDYKTFFKPITGKWETEFKKSEKKLKVEEKVEIEIE